LRAAKRSGENNLDEHKVAAGVAICGWLRRQQQTQPDVADTNLRKDR
jgi:hypothetical protein